MPHAFPISLCSLMGAFSWWTPLRMCHPLWLWALKAFFFFESRGEIIPLLTHLWWSVSTDTASFSPVIPWEVCLYSVNICGLGLPNISAITRTNEKLGLRVKTENTHVCLSQNKGFQAGHITIMRMAHNTNSYSYPISKAHKWELICVA